MQLMHNSEWDLGAKLPDSESHGRPGQCFLYGFGDLVGAQKIGDFVTVNNKKLVSMCPIQTLIR